MFLKNLHLSTAILYILHSIVSIVIGAIVSFLLFVGQNAFTGSADLKAVLLGGLSVAAVYFTSHIGPLFSSPQAVQAGEDVLNDIKATLDQHGAILQALASQPVPPASAPPVPQAPVQPAQFAFPYAPSSTFPLPVVTPQ